MNFSLDTIKNKFRASPKKKALKEFGLIQRKTKSKHAWAGKHWSVAKVLLMIFVMVAAYFQYQFYEQINQDAFQSTAEVAPVGTSNIDVDSMFSVLTTERSRADFFAESLEYGPVSFDPSRYDIVLLPANTPTESTENNSTSSLAE